MTKLLRIVVPLGLLVSLSLACGLNPLRRTNLATDVPATLEALVEEGEVEAEATEPPAEASPEAGEEAGGEELDLSSVTSGLEALDSYASHLEVATLEGGTATPTGTLVMDTEYVREPRAERVVMRSGGSEDAVEIIQVGGQQYFVLGEGQCMSSQAEEGDTLGAEGMQPDDLVGELQGAKRVLPDETVNGVLCRHYTFDQNALTGTGAFSSAQGEVWVSVEGEFVVKYVLQAQGSDSSTGQETEFTMLYELREVNSGLTIEPPAGCEANQSDFPTMADATNVTSMSGILMYESASPLADVVAFYQEQMPAQGWAAAGDATITADTAMLSYTKDGGTASIIISSSEGTVSVMITSEGTGEAAPAE